MNKLYLFLLFVLFSFKSIGQTGRSVCVGDTIILHGTGGVWVNGDTTIAVIDSFTGVLTGRSAGIVTVGYRTSLIISYTTITVNPTPVLSSPLTPPSICDSAIFNYTPASSTAGTVFAWSRVVTPGIGLIASSGTGNPNEQLINATFVPIGVAYSYTLTAAGCTNMQTVTVTVNPNPKLSSTLTPDAICDSALFIYVPTSLTPGCGFSWTRPAVSGMLPLTSFGSGSVNEVLDNTTSASVTVTYFFRLSLGACIGSYSESVQVMVATCRVGVNELNKPDDGIKVYPNPSYGAFKVEAPVSSDIVITDLAGRILLQCSCIANGSGGMTAEEFDEHLLPGIYLISVSTEERVYTQKLVIW